MQPIELKRIGRKNSWWLFENGRCLALISRAVRSLGVSYWVATPVYPMKPIDGHFPTKDAAVKAFLAAQD
jgi:hypothetical protein